MTALGKSQSQVFQWHIQKHSMLLRLDVDLGYLEWSIIDDLQLSKYSSTSLVWHAVSDASRAMLPCSPQDTGRGQRLRQLFGGYRGQDIWAILRKLKSMDDGHGPLVEVPSGLWQDPAWLVPAKKRQIQLTNLVILIYLYIIFVYICILHDWIYHDTYINYSCIWLSADGMVLVLYELIST